MQRLGTDEASTTDESQSSITFGQLNSADSRNIKNFKNEALEKVFGNRQNDNERERYNNAIRSIASGSDNAEMLIKDGCFFLHLALAILGCRKQLGYTPDHLIFGDTNIRRGINNRIRDMFSIDNQIPHLVYRTLMDDKFFTEKVVLAARWKWMNFTPSTLCEKALYQLLILPVLNKNPLCPWISRPSKGCKTTEDSSQPQYASHILHALQNLLIFGTKKHLRYVEHEIEVNGDMEANRNAPVVTNTNAQRDNQVSTIYHSVSILKQLGIHVEASGEGIRSIGFKDWLFCAKLYLPTFLLDDNTEKILENLIRYEGRFKYYYQREVGSYIKFMSGIVHTEKDAKWLCHKKIVQPDSRHVPQLPAILRRLASLHDTEMTPQLEAVKRQIKDYNGPWGFFKNFVSFILMLTLIQTIVALLPYCRIPPPK